MRMFPDFELQFATCLPTADSIAGTQALGLLSATIYVCLHQQTQTQTHRVDIQYFKERHYNRTITTLQQNECAYGLSIVSIVRACFEHYLGQLRIIINKDNSATAPFQISRPLLSHVLCFLGASQIVGCDEDCVGGPGCDPPGCNSLYQTTT